MAYEVTGGATFKSNVQTIVSDLVYDQNGAGGQLPANRIDGGLYHTGEQHDITEASSADVIIASSWMSALVVDPMVRIFGVWQDNPQIPDFIVRMGNFEKAASLTDSDGQFGGTTRYPDYLMRADGTPDSRSDTDVQHAMDVGAVAAWATYFADLRGTPDASLRQLANDLYSTYQIGVNFWTSSTSFTVQPPRRYTWEYKNSASFSWALTAADASTQAGMLQFSAANYSVVENQGTATITVTRTHGSSGSVTVNYSTSNGTATAGSDYAATSGTLTFTNGETTKTFTVPIINDTAVENAETVTLTLSNATGGAALMSPATATLTILSDDASDQPITTTLQQGVNGYTGTTDAEISTQYADSTGGNGSTDASGSQLGVYQLAGTGGYTIESLIRFSDLGITSNSITKATVTGATLTLNVETFDANPTIRGYYLTAPWTTVPGSNLGWIHRGTGQNWASPGALGQDADVLAGKSFVLSGITGSGAQTITVNLDPAVVQSWIDNPDANQGLLLVNETTGAVVRIDASENATVGVRPKLSVSYLVSAPTQQQAASLQFSNATYSVNENQGTATITVTRSGDTTGSVTVLYATSNGTATAGSDYTAASGTLTFAAGEASKTFTVSIIDDTLVEGNETVNLTLSSPSGGATLGSPASASLTIVDNDAAQPGVLQFSAATYSVNEGQGSATITVTRTGGSNVPVSINYSTSNGTATAGSDYTATTGTLSFAAGETSKTFTVSIIDDTLVEGNETVNLTLSSPGGGVTLGSPASASLTILDNDAAQPGVLQFSAATYSVSEGQGTATITVTRTGGSNVPVSINYSTSNGTATAGNDYTATTGTLSFAAGETSKTFTVPIIDDTLVEGNETVNLTLSSPGGGATLGSPSTAALTIVDNDTAGQSTTASFQQGMNGYTGTTDVTISTQYAQYNQGNGTTSINSTQLGVYQLTGAGSYASESLIRFSNLGIPNNATVSSATITINLENWVGSPTIRGYYVLGAWNGTSGSQLGWIHRGTGQDWATPGALGQGTDIVAGDSFVVPGITATGSQFITINLDPAVVQSWINNPNADQGILFVNETPGAVVQINASENTAANTRPQLRVTYNTGSAAPQPGDLQFSAAAYSVNENQGTATITVTRTNGSSGAIAVNYATSNGTATAGSDYTATNGTLTFADGEVSKTFTIPITNDTLVEGNETVNLTLSGPTGGATIGSQATATLTIVDDDVSQPSVLQFNAAAYSVNEAQGTATITVTRTGGSNVPVSIRYATSDGTATAGSDYSATSGTLSFAAGETNKTFTIPIINDTQVEGNETVNLTLSSPTGGATLGSQATATLTIVDDEVSQPGVLQFNAAAYSVNEAQGTATITVTRTGGSNVPVTIHYATSDGTATAGADYSATSGTLSFAAGETSKTFTIPIINDTLVEGNETVNLTLSSPTGGATLGNQAMAILTIVDDDGAQSGTVSLQQGVNGYTGTTDASISTQYAQYNAGNGTTTLGAAQLGVYQLTGASGYTVEDLIRFNNLGIPTNATVSGATLTLNVYTWSANATIRGYYLLPPWSTAPGANSLGWIHRGTGQDWTSPGAAGQGSDVVAGKSFVLPGITGTGAQTITVNLDPAMVQNWINNPNADQGILLVNETTGAVVQVSASGNATVASRPKLSVTYSVGAAATLLSISITPTNPSIANGQTTQFTATGHFSDGSNQVLTSGVTWSSSNTSIATIATNGLATAIGVGSDTITAVDGSFSSTTTLTVTAATTNPTLGAHAVAFVPFNSPAGSLSTNPITTQASGSTVLAWVGRGTLNTFTSATAPTDNHGNTAIQVDSTHSFAPLFPNSGMALYNFPSFAGGPGDVFTVPMPVADEVTVMVVEIKNGGLIQDEQWNQISSGAQTSLSVTTTGPATLVSFWTGDSSASSVTAVPNNGFTVIDSQLLANDAIEAAVATKDVSTAGTYNVTWSATPQQTGYIWLVAVQHGTPVVHPGKVQFSSSTYSVNENQGTANITVTRTGGSDGAVSVNFATSNGTATAGSDYTPTSGTLTFAAGETSKTFTVPITNDTMVEGNETINLTLSNPMGGATLGSPSMGTLTIVDDDTPPPVGKFTNVTDSSGVTAIIAQKYQEDPNWWLSGEHLVDLDNDGDLDLFLDSHTGGSVVALNDGHGHFTRITTGSWPDLEIHEMDDINGDGKVDLNATFGDGGSQWWINHSTPGVVNFTPTSVTRDGNTSRSQVLFDFNGDGKVDWFRSAEPGLVVDFGDGNGGFTAGSKTFTIPGTDSNDNASFLPGDYDGDGKIDLLVLIGGNYDGTPGAIEYWHNNGNMTFTDVTASSGLPTNGTIAKGIGDFNQDGDLDIIAIENMSMPPVIYQNDGHGNFTKKANAISGVAAESLDYTSWGTAITTDFDNDGVPDIIMDGKYYLKVLRGTGGGNFVYMNNTWGITDTAASSVDDGLCFGDIDGDGKLDVIGYNETFPSRTLNVYHNDLAAQNFLNIRPVGLAGNTGAAGATISIYAAGTTQLLWSEQVAQYDFQVATSSYGYNETERHFGLGSRASVDVVVQFASGRVTRVNNVAANQTIRVLESAGNPPGGAPAAPNAIVSGTLGTSAGSSDVDRQSMGRAALASMAAGGADWEQLPSAQFMLADLANGMSDRRASQPLEIDDGLFAGSTPQSHGADAMTTDSLAGGTSQDTGEFEAIADSPGDPEIGQRLK